MAADTLPLVTNDLFKKYGAAVPLVMSHATGKPFGRKCLPKNM